MKIKDAPEEFSDVATLPAKSCNMLQADEHPMENPDFFPACQDDSYFLFYLFICLFTDANTQLSMQLEMIRNRDILNKSKKGCVSTNDVIHVHVVFEQPNNND